MRASFEEMIEIAYEIKLFFKLPSYQVFAYDDGAYCDFRVKIVNNVPLLVRKAANLELKIIPDDGFIIVRLFENFNE